MIIKKLFYKLLTRYFNKQFEKADSLILQHDYFSIVSALDSITEFMKGRWL